MTDIFAVQDDVAAAIIDALQIHVGTNPTRGRPTESPEAYTLFLKAKVLLNAQDGLRASKLLRQVTELDPDFAEAHELQAASYWNEAGGFFDVAEGFRLSGEAAAKALAINPDLAFAQALYYLATDKRSHVDAIDALKRAWRENPGDVAPLRPLIYELSSAGYLREANRIAIEYVNVDPLSPTANYSLGETLHAIGESNGTRFPDNRI